MSNRCNCMCGCDTNQENSPLENVCDNVQTKNTNMYRTNNKQCQCGFNEPESVFPLNPMLGQSYVPIQTMTNTFSPCCGLKNGTIFPELVSPYQPNQSIEDIEYLRNRNTIGKGCNR